MKCVATAAVQTMGNIAGQYCVLLVAVAYSYTLPSGIQCQVAGAEHDTALPRRPFPKAFRETAAAGVLLYMSHEGMQKA